MQNISIEMRKCFRLILKGKISVFSFNNLEKRVYVSRLPGNRFDFCLFVTKVIQDTALTLIRLVSFKKQEVITLLEYPCFFCTVRVAHQFSSPGRLLLSSLDERRPSSVYLSHFNFLLGNRLAKWSESWKEASMEDPLFRLFISSRSLFLK
jgi:hypothetical protein